MNLPFVRFSQAVGDSHRIGSIEVLEGLVGRQHFHHLLEI